MKLGRGLQGRGVKRREEEGRGRKRSEEEGAGGKRREEEGRAGQCREEQGRAQGRVGLACVSYTSVSIPDAASPPSSQAALETLPLPSVPLAPPSPSLSTMALDAIVSCGLLPATPAPLSGVPSAG